MKGLCFSSVARPACVRDESRARIVPFFTGMLSVDVHVHAGNRGDVLSCVRRRSGEESARIFREGFIFLLVVLKWRERTLARADSAPTLKGASRGGAATGFFPF